jgi:hypothetical protein
MVGVEDGFQREARKAAGGLWSTVSFGGSFNPSIRCELRGTGDIRRCARARDEAWG